MKDIMENNYRIMDIQEHADGYLIGKYFKINAEKDAYLFETTLFSDSNDFLHAIEEYEANAFQNEIAQ